MATVQCTRRVHRVATHIAGSAAALECAASSGKHGLSALNINVLVLSSTHVTVDADDRDDHVLAGKSGFAEFLRTSIALELDRVTSINPGYSQARLVEEATESIMDELEDIDGAWEDLHPANQRQMSRDGDRRARRVDLSGYVEDYLSRNS